MQPGILLVSIAWIFILCGEGFAEIIYKDTVNGVTFNEAGNLTDFSYFYRYISYRSLQFDQYVNGNILYLLGGSLQTMDYETMIPETVVGSASVNGYREGVGSGAVFLNPRDVCQINETHAVIADTTNYCLRLVSRVTNSSSPLVGNCGMYTSAPVDGSFAVTRLWGVHAVAKLSDYLLVVAEYRPGPYPFRLINLFTEEAHTWRLNGISFTNSVSQWEFLRHPSVDTVYFSYKNRGFGMIDLDTNVTSMLIDPDIYGHNDGPFDQSAFRETYPLTFLNNDTILVGPTYPYYEFRVIDLVTNTTATVTQGSPIRYTSSLLPIPAKGIVLLGLRGQLGYLSVSGSGYATQTAEETTEPSLTTNTLKIKPGTTNELEQELPAPTDQWYITAITSLGFGGVLLIIVVMLAVFQFKLQKARSRPVMSTSSEPYPQTAKTSYDKRIEEENQDIYDDVSDGGETNLSFVEGSNVNRYQAAPECKRPTDPQYLNMTAIGRK